MKTATWLLLILTASGTAQDRKAAPNPELDLGQARLVKEVRHELVMLPYYDVFDNLSYRVEGTTITLMGQVTRPTLKTDAANVVKHLVKCFADFVTS